jgi:hypothetical protein
MPHRKLPVRHGRKLRAEQRTGPTVESAPDSADLSAHWRTWDAFLDQGRWLLGEQQKRTSTFQTNAVALLGFDGVLLALLVGTGVVTVTQASPTAWWAARVGAAAIAASALCAVAAVVPRSTGTVATSDTLNGWTDFHVAETHDPAYQAAQHFANMLLASDAVESDATGRLARARAKILRRVRRWTRREEPSTQVLIAARRLATARGRWTTGAAAFLAAGVLALVVVVYAAPPASEPHPEPSMISPR